MLLMTAEQRAAVVAAAEAAWPAEGCGLLIGRGSRRKLVVTDILPADNLLRHLGNDRFELDPAVRFAAERAVRGTECRVIGHWHSHPDGSSRPSRTDLAQAWEPDLIWLIVGVAADFRGRPQVSSMAAHRLDRARNRAYGILLRIAKKRACHDGRFPT